MESNVSPAQSHGAPVRPRVWRARSMLAVALSVPLLLSACGSTSSSSSTSEGAPASDAASTAAASESASPATSPEDALAGLTGSVSLNSSGGAVFDIWDRTWWGPFTEKTGVPVTPSSPNDFAKLAAAVNSGNVDWNLVEISTGSQFIQAQEEGLLEKLDLAKLQADFEAFGGTWTDIVPSSLKDYGVWLTPYSTVLIYDKRAFPDKAPTSLADLWNTEEFPGKRCVSAYAMYALEAAAYANSGSRDAIYPLDVDAAIAKYEEIKPEVAKFWTTGQEPIQLVSDGECVMSTAWNGRAFTAQVLEGIDYLGTVWDGGVLHDGYWVIPKGAPDADAAYAALAYYLLPEVGAASANESGYGNSNTAAAELTNEEARAFVATDPANLAVEIIQDNQWWFENGPAAEEAWAAWQLQ